MAPFFTAHSLLSRKFRLTPVALVALTCCFHNVVLAQGAPSANSDNEAPTLGSVTVTGYRSSNAQVISAKRESDVTVDSLAADEIGALPDFNIGDALSRVTGVSIVDYQGEPRYVTIRGLNGNYNVTQIDGFALASTDVGARQMLMEVLPSSVAQRIDVFKTFLPEMDGSAVGGLTNIRSASAFNFADNSFRFSGKAGENQMDSKFGGNRPLGEAQARWAKRFGEANEFGLLLAGSYWKRETNVPQIENGGSLNWYNNAGVRQTSAYSGNGFAVPTERRWYNYDNDRERAGLTGRLDWRPEGKLSGNVSAYYFNQKEKSDRHTQLASVANTATVSGQTPTSGTLSNVGQLIQLGRLRWERETYGVNGEMKYEITPELIADVRGSTSRASVSNPQTWDQFKQNNMAFSYDWSDSLPTFTPVNVANANNASRYTMNNSDGYHQLEEKDYFTTVNDLQFNLKNNMDKASRGLGTAVGGRLLTSSTDNRQSSTRWFNMAYTLADVQSGSSLCGLQCNSNLLLIDPDKADSVFKRFASTVAARDEVATRYGNTYKTQEDIASVYMQGQYRMDNWLVSGGVRLEDTSFNTDGFDFRSNAWVATSKSKNYQNVLPSVLAVLDTSQDSKLRMAFSQTLGRPRPDQMAQRTSSVNVSNSPPTMTLGNPALEPRRSTNYDLGHEWYLGKGQGIFSATAFYKEISDEIFNYGELQTVNVSGTPQTVLVTQARNSAGLTKMMGVEFGFSRELDVLSPALKGFGVSANATFLDVKFPVSLTSGSGAATTNVQRTLNLMPQQANEMWNMAVHYQKGSWAGRLAWKHVGRLWDDRFPNYTVEGLYRNRYQEPTDTFDMQVSYAVSKKVSASIDFLNITGQGRRYTYGNSQEYVQSEWKLAPSIMLGMSIKL